jgi:hypothetical protein
LTHEEASRNASDKADHEPRDAAERGIASPVATDAAHGAAETTIRFRAKRAGAAPHPFNNAQLFLRFTKNQLYDNFNNR